MKIRIEYKNEQEDIIWRASSVTISMIGNTPYLIYVEDGNTHQTNLEYVKYLKIN